MKLRVRLFGKNHFYPGENYTKNVDYSNYYRLYLECKNCITKTETYIKKGVHVNDIITHIKCNNCGCRLEKI